VNDVIKFQLRGFIKIVDKATGKTLVDKSNAVHFGNISTEIAQALSGDKNSFITYMVFGNGGIVNNDEQRHIYRKPNAGDFKNTKEQLYNPTFAIELTNSASDGVTCQDVDVYGGVAGAYEDILVRVSLANNIISLQSPFNKAAGSSDQNPDDPSTTYVFNELALYTGPKSFGNRQTAEQIEEFLNHVDTTLITHVIFHPIQKSKNTALDIDYMLRIQMADCDDGACYPAPAPTGPTIDQHPQNTTVIEGQIASFNVVATSSGGTLTYQWYETNAGALPGETADSISFVAVLGDTGDVYYVVVSDDNGIEQSNTAVVTVNSIPIVDDNLLTQNGSDLLFQDNSSIII